MPVPRTCRTYAIYDKTQRYAAARQPARPCRRSQQLLIAREPVLRHAATRGSSQAAAAHGQTRRDDGRMPLHSATRQVSRDDGITEAPH